MVGKNKLYITLLTVTTVVLTGGIFYVFAAPPASPYAPGETLAPTCAPGSLNCTVTAPAMSGANSDITSLIGSALTIGDATTDRLTILSQLLGGSPIVFQGATDDVNTLTINVADPTGANTITFPDASGTVITSGNTSDILDLSPSHFITADISQWTNDAGYVTSGSISSALSSITAATAANLIDNGDNAQSWHWQKSSAGAGITFSDEDISGLLPATSVVEIIAESGSNAIPLYIKNYGTGRSLQVDDVATDLTQFFIDSEGRMVLGADVSNPLAKLTVSSDASFTNSIAATGTVDQNLNISVRNSSDTALATSLFVASADNIGELFPFHNSVAFGMTSSAFSNPLQSLAGPNDAFLVGIGNDLFIGNGTPFYVDPTSAIRFVVGGQQDNITLPPGAPYFGAPTGINGEKMRIATNGNVGIGTSAPTATLDIKQYTANYFGAAPDALHLSGSTSGYVGFNPPAVAGSTTYTLPGADGSVGSVLSTNGAGILTWSSTAQAKWDRTGTTIFPVFAGDDVTTNTTGNIYTAAGFGGTITADGLLTGNTGLTVSGGAVSLNANSNFATNINTGTSTGAVSIGNSLAGAVGITSGAALNLTGGAASMFSTTAGAITLQPAGAGTTSAVQIGVGGVGSTTPDLLALDVKSTTGDPVGANGQMYYNLFSNQFRCYVNGSWANCDTTGGTATLQSAYNAGATITTAAATDLALTLTSGNFTATGAGSVLLTPTGASSFTSGGALTFTAGAASTWGTSSGDLTLQVAGAGTASVKIGTGGAGTATPDLLTLDVKSTAGDPAGVNGAMYYNAVSNLFRCYENSGWKDCSASASGASTLQQSYSAGSTITTTGSTDLDFILTSGNFEVTGAGSVLLTPTGASSFTSSGALTLTAGAASTWGTTSGNLSLVIAGTGTGNVQIGDGGVATATPDLLVLDTGTTDPVGTNGAMYYDVTTDTFRCFEAGAWIHCGSSLPTSTTLQDAYDNSGNITTSGNNSITFNLASGGFNITGAGLVNITGLTASKVVFTDASKNLTSTGTVGIDQGGTGQTTKTAAYDALSPTTTKGDLITRDSLNNIRLGVGTNGQVLTANSATATGLQWTTISVAADSLNFSDFADVMTLDASTNITFGADTLSLTFTNNGTANEVHNLTSTGDFVIQDNGVTFATFSDTGAITFNNLTISGLTPNSFVYSGVGGLLTTTAAPTNGQILIGSTGAAPVATTITAGTGISVTNGAGSITIATTGGGITLSAIGSTPNANAATLTGSVLNLEPASASFGGVVTTGTQTFAGLKTFSSLLTAGAGLTANGTITQTGANGIITGTLGIDYTDSDTNPTCGAGEYKIYADTSELKLKKCMNGVVTDLDSAGGAGTDLQMSKVQLTDIASLGSTAGAAGNLLGTVSVTPTTATGDIYVYADLYTSSLSNTDQTITYEIRSGSVCNGGAILSSSTSALVGSNGQQGPSGHVAYLTVDPGASAQTYAICAYSSIAASSSAGGVAVAMVIDTGADLAEIYTTHDIDLEAGDLVSNDYSLKTGVQKTTKQNQISMMGIVSTRPGQLIGSVDKEGRKAVPIALAGRVPLKVTNENGYIKAGDYLTASSKPGYAMKATKPGMVIGQAMADWGSANRGPVMTFIKNTYYSGENITSQSLSLDATQLSSLEGLVFSNVIVNGMVINGSLAIKAETEFFGTPYFTTDTAGFATIKKGSDKVEVTFDHAYLAQPIVSTNITLNDNTSNPTYDAEVASVLEKGYSYIVAKKSTKGFTIYLNKQAQEDISFSWIALAVKNAKEFTSIKP